MLKEQMEDVGKVKEIMSEQNENINKEIEILNRYQKGSEIVKYNNGNEKLTTELQKQI